MSTSIQYVCIISGQTVQLKVSEQDKPKSIISITLREIVVADKDLKDHEFKLFEHYPQENLALSKSDDGVWTIESSDINFGEFKNVKVHANYDEQSNAFSVWGEGFGRAAFHITRS